jgi:SAM-dependent methyltransferase
VSALLRLNLDPIKSSVSQTLYSENQQQTESTFAFKWTKRDTYESPAFQSMAKEWLMERYCDNNPSVLDEWLEGDSKIILDAGCGSGHSALLFFGDKLNQHDYLGIDISDAVDTARARFKEKNIKGDFLKMSLMDLPLAEKSIDMIFSEGVLHHTDSTEKSIKYLSNFLRPGGKFLFYVYRKKSPIREFTDDHIRNHLQNYPNEDAWNMLKPLTKLGEQLGKMNINIDVSEDIPYLGIKKGKMDLQRFFYWHICKLYYRNDFTLEEMNHINFDWFRPKNCHRHTPEEIQTWCAESQLKIMQMNVRDAGITVVATKNNLSNG